MNDVVALAVCDEDRSCCEASHQPIVYCFLFIVSCLHSFSCDACGATNSLESLRLDRINRETWNFEKS